MNNPNYTNALNKLVTKGDTGGPQVNTIKEILKLWAALTVIAVVILTCIYSLLIEISEPGTTGRTLKVVLVTGWEWLLH